MSRQVRDGELVGPQSPPERPSPRQDAPHLVGIHRQRCGDRLGILSQAMQAADRLREQQAPLLLCPLLRLFRLLLRLLRCC